jgi:AcrR family transcriptional regulator
VVNVYEPPADSAALFGRRERKKQETRAALEAAALRLFAERGYEQTTVEDIADAADVAVRTFFRYFSSKQHVLFGDVAHSIVGRLQNALLARPADEPPVEAVAHAMDGLELETEEQYQQVTARMQLVREMPELMPAYLMVLHQMHETIARFVGERTGESPTAMYPQLLAGVAMLAAKTALAEPERSAEAQSELRRRAFRALAPGLSSVPQAPPRLRSM